MKEKKILISSCLLNNLVRCDGRIINFKNPMIDKLKSRGLLIKLCPEVDGGLSIHRIPAELQINAAAIYKEKTGILNKNGQNVTSFFLRGIKKVDEIIEKYQIEYAVLKENSPSCGVNYVYDGTFSGNLIPGEGVLAYYLRQKKIQVYSEKELGTLETKISMIEGY